MASHQPQQPDETLELKSRLWQALQLELASSDESDEPLTRVGLSSPASSRPPQSPQAADSNHTKPLVRPVRHMPSQQEDKPLSHFQKLSQRLQMENQRPDRPALSLEPSLLHRREPLEALPTELQDEGSHGPSLDILFPNSSKSKKPNISPNISDVPKPQLEPEPEVDSIPVVEEPVVTPQEPEPEPELEPEPEHEAGLETEPEVEPDSKAESEQEPELEPEPELKPVSHTQTVSIEGLPSNLVLRDLSKIHHPSHYSDEKPMESENLQPEQEAPLSSPEIDGKNQAPAQPPVQKNYFSGMLTVGAGSLKEWTQPSVSPSSGLSPAHRQANPPQIESSPDVSYKGQEVSNQVMADLSGYKDLSRAPMAKNEGEDSSSPSSSTTATSNVTTPSSSVATQPQNNQFGSLEKRLSQLTPEAVGLDATLNVDTEFSGNVQTLIRLVSELPEGVTKQTGAQIIRLTMEAMGISMEDVLSEAQSAQSEMLEAVRANIKKIEEFKTVIRKLESDIKFYQGKANELSEIIDLFILSNASTGKVPNVDELTR